MYSCRCGKGVSGGAIDKVQTARLKQLQHQLKGSFCPGDAIHDNFNPMFARIECSGGDRFEGQLLFDIELISFRQFNIFHRKDFC